MVFYQSEHAPFPAPGDAATHFAVVLFAFVYCTCPGIEVVTSRQELIFMIVAQIGINSQVLPNVCKYISTIPPVVIASVFIVPVLVAEYGVHRKGEERILVIENIQPLMI